MGYGTADDFATRATFPRDQALLLQQRVPGFLQGRIDAYSADIDAQLYAGYETPFVPYEDGTYPLILASWVYAQTAADAWLKLGRASTDEDVVQTLSAAEAAREQIKLAANSETGLYGLPRRQNGPGGRTKGGVISYTETSPYVGQRRQAWIGKAEDARGAGTFRAVRRPIR